LAGICRRPGGGGGGGEREDFFKQRREIHLHTGTCSSAHVLLARKTENVQTGGRLVGVRISPADPAALGRSWDAGGESDRGAGWLWGNPGRGSLQGAGLT